VYGRPVGGGLGVAFQGCSVCAGQVSMVVWGFCGREPHLATTHTVVFAPCTVALVAPVQYSALGKVLVVVCEVRIVDAGPD